MTTTETDGIKAAQTIDADKLFTEIEQRLIKSISGWEEYEDQCLRALYGDPRTEAESDSANNDADPLASESTFDSDDPDDKDRWLAFLNGDGPDPLAGGGDDDKGKDEADDEPSIDVLLREFMGPKFDGLATAESRKRLLVELGGDGSVFSVKTKQPEVIYCKLLHYFGHIPRETLDGINISTKSRTGSGSGSYGSDGERKRVFAEYLLTIPFNITTRTHTIAEVRKSLEGSLYGLREAKRKIIEHLTLSAHGSGKFDSLLLVGPPGTGKTALGSVIASSLGVPFSKVSLAGMPDILTLRGSNSSWSAAQPGLLIKEMVRCRTQNYVCLLDEIDKSAGFNAGRVIDVMAELLDPKQNHAFRDLFLELEIDFSRVLFIATANDLSAIPDYIVDRCAVIEIEPYTEAERAVIIKQYMVRQLLSDYHFNFEIEIKDGAVKEFAKITSLRETRRAVMSHIAWELQDIEPGRVGKVVIKRYRPELVPPKGNKNSKGKRIGFCSQRDDNPQGGSQGPSPGM